LSHFDNSTGKTSSRRVREQIFTTISKDAESNLPITSKLYKCALDKKDPLGEPKSIINKLHFT